MNMRFILDQEDVSCRPVLRVALNANGLAVIVDRLPSFPTCQPGEISPLWRSMAWFSIT